MSGEGEPPENLPSEISSTLGDLSSGMKLKFAKFALKLVGSHVAQEALMRMSDTADAMRARAIYSDAMARAAAAHAAADPAMVARWMSRNIERELTGQKNLEEITRLAAEELSAEENVEEPVADIADDWRRRFSNYAGDVSEPEMQKIWSRVLKGEFKEPGTFSYQTLRILSEMDQSVANDFAEFAEERFSENAVFSPPGSFSSGEKFNRLSKLRAWGLVMDKEGETSRPLRPQEGRQIVWGHWWSGTIFAQNLPRPIKVPIVRFSTVGLELLKLLDVPDEKETIRRILVHLQPQIGSESVGLIFRNTSPGNLTFVDGEFVWGDGETWARVVRTGASPAPERG